METINKLKYVNTFCDTTVGEDEQEEWIASGNGVEGSGAGVCVGFAPCISREEATRVGKIMFASLDLLEALEDCVGLLQSLTGISENGGGQIDYQIEEAESVIRKAKGESHE